ncbi:Pkinase domain-containing protein [Cephalotus follicularis]|uniref:non-specific serine/threonine protein kinase n=1 Tax=Cephalotus follicularis TaxID=3775 RepID=A0A1Q3AZQ7_CEPFO|nr:Pkinase domain-containing protein [Cephalotus follicularis]
MVGFNYEDLVKATDSFSPSNLIGKGSHGSVYKGILQNNNLVAIKKPSIQCHEVSHDDNSKKLDNEIHVLSSLRENPCVINFIGTSRDSVNKDIKILVMEFMPNGSLHDLLHVVNTPPSWPKRVEIAIQVARAVKFLHEGKPLVIHRDIKPANILIDSNWKPKLADFGLAVMLQVDSLLGQVSDHKPAGTMGYLDPFYTSPSKLGTKNDIFSFGVVLLEIISCRKVIDVTKSPSSIVEWATTLIKEERMMEICDTRIVLPSYMDATIGHMLDVACRCVSPKEEIRPSIVEIVMEMENFVVERVNKNPIWISVLRSVILAKQRRNLAKKLHPNCKCATQKGDMDNDNDIARGRLLLTEVLADVTLQ